MDLQTAATRYEENRRFWAREMAVLLTHGSYRRQVAILRLLAAHGDPMSADGIAASLFAPYANQHSRETSVSGLLLKLLGAALVTRTKKGLRYWYALTELGGLVLMYLPETEMKTGDKARARHMPASALGVFGES